ncbi:MAG: hypothetical protein ACPGSL_04615 [Vicingaceae bacterium]
MTLIETNRTFINLGFATVKMREDGIVNTNILFSGSATLEQATELFNAYKEVTKGIKTPHLFTVAKLAIMEKDVMEFLSKVSPTYGKADAFVIHSLAQKIIATAFIKFQKPAIPTNFFSSEKEATKWLTQYL